MGRVECEKNYLIVALVVLGICYFELRWSLKEMGGVFVFGVVVLGLLIAVSSMSKEIQTRKED